MSNAISVFRKLNLSSKSKPWKLEKPVVVQFPVNDICNARCQMCNIWQQKLKKQLTPDKLQDILLNPLFSEVKTIGVNGGEPTLRKDLAKLVDIMFDTLPNLSDISLITNGINAEQVIQRISDVGQIVRKHHGNLDVMVSLDGVGNVHDNVRGRKGAFDKAVQVIDFINSATFIRNKSLGCTVIKENIYGIHDLLEFAIEKDIYIKYRLGIPHQRLYSENLITPFFLSWNEKYHLAIFLQNLIQHYEVNLTQKHFYESLVNQIMYKSPRSAGCDWQHRGVTLSAAGELLYCAVESQTLGSALDEDAMKVYFDNEEHLADIVANKCDDCMHDYIGIPPFRELILGYISKIKKLVKTGFGIQLFGIVGFANRFISFYLRRRRLKKIVSDSPKGISDIKNQPIREILICGWYGTETLGDKAILGGVIQGLQEGLDEIELHLASFEPFITETTIQQMPELANCKTHDIFNAIKIVSSMDLIVFGGGPIMALNELAEITEIFKRANKANIPIILAGVGVGPFGAAYLNREIKTLLKLSSKRIYRDQESLTRVSSLGVAISKDKDIVAEDPAFTWLKKNKKCTPSESRYILLGLRDWPYQEYAYALGEEKAKDIKRNFEENIISTILALGEKYPDIKIMPFPMCTNARGGDDRWYYRKLFRQNQTVLKYLDNTYLNAELSPSESIRVFCNASAVISMRYHSLVFSIALDIPTVSIDYTLGNGKVSALRHKYNIPQIRIDDFSSDLLIKEISIIFESDKNQKQFQEHLELNFSNSLVNAISEI